MVIAMILPMTVACSQTGTDETTDAAVGETQQTSETVSADDVPSESEIEALLSSKVKLTFNDDGSFRVLIIADTHMDTDAAEDLRQNVKDRIKVMVDRENPDLVIFTGDNTIKSTEESIKTNLDMLVGYIEEKQIPWCHVYGNHDFENAMSTDLQQEVYESYKYCISKAGPADISGVGNYVNGIYNKDGSLGAVIYCLDSGAYASDGGYDYIKQDQIDWYKETSEKLQAYNNGNAVPALMAFHIPLIENDHAYQNKDNTALVTVYDGNRNEAICSSATDTTLFETILERKDVKAIVTGHDHVNDYMYNYKGVKLCSSPNLSEMTYHTQAFWGSRVFDMNLATIDDMPTYVSYFHEKVDVGSLEAYADKTVLAYTADTVGNAVIQSWNGGAVSGNVALEITDEHGYDNSDALSVTRSSTGNFEFFLELENKGKLGDNEYLIVWADFSDIEFRKACFGLYGAYDTAAAFRTDDTDTVTPLYYLPDGKTEWVSLKHGSDGCFGAGDEGSQGMKGKKGYFAFPVENMAAQSENLDADSPIYGIYFYGDIVSSSYANFQFFFDYFMLVADYHNFKS